jgi:hypothetical protein
MKTLHWQDFEKRPQVQPFTDICNKADSLHQSFRTLWDLKLSPGRDVFRVLWDVALCCLVDSSRRYGQTY